MTSLLPALSGLLQLVAVGVLVAELVAYQRLSSWYVRLLRLRADAPPSMPAVRDPARLEGLQGAEPGLRYRWDARRGELLFGRQMGVLLGERGQLVGAVRFGPDGAPSVRWRPAPLCLLPAVLVFGGLGLGYFALVEGEWAALAGLPVLAVAFVLLTWMQWANGRALLHRVLLPMLVGVVREHLGLDAAGEPAAEIEAAG